MTSPELRLLEAPDSRKAESSGEIDLIGAALKEAGVHSITHQKEIRREMARCELALTEAFSLAPKDERGLAEESAQDELAHEYSRIIRESDKRILEILNKSNPKNPFTVLSPVIAERLGRFSQTDAEQSEFDAQRAAMANRGRPQTLARPEPSIATKVKLSENNNMKPDSFPSAERIIPQEKKPEIPPDIKDEIERVLIEARQEEEEIERAAGGIHNVAARRAVFEGSHRQFGERIHGILENWQRRTRQPILMGIPEEYMKRLPGDRYVRGRERVAEARISSPGIKQRGAETTTPEPAAVLDSADAENNISGKLKKARQRREERGSAGDGAEAHEQSIAAEQSLTPEDSIDNPDFRKYLLAYFPDGNIPDKGMEVRAAQVELFNKHQETTRAVADFYAELMETDGIVKVDKAAREEFRSSIDAFLLKNVRNQPALAEQLMAGITNYREAPVRIAETEKILAELGSRETLEAQRDALRSGKQHIERIRDDIGKGPLRSFLKGFASGFSQETTSKKATVGGRGDLKTEVTIERKLTWRERLTRGWRSGLEAKEKSQIAKGDMSSKSFRVIDEALNAGALEDLESKIQTLDDAERQKKIVSEAFDQARMVIFGGVGELSGVVGKMRKKAMATLQKMTSGEESIASLQESFDRLIKVRERFASNDASYIDSESVEGAITDVEALIELEFENKIYKLLSKDLSEDKPYAALRKMLGKFARLENLGSKHSGEVREFFVATVADYLKRNKDVSAEKRLILNRIMVTFGEREEEKATQDAPETPVEKHEKKAEIPKVGDMIRIRGQVDGESEYRYFEGFRIDEFRHKGETPKPKDKMKISGSFMDGSGAKRIEKLTITYAQYREWNLNHAEEQHA